MNLNVYQLMASRTATEHDNELVNYGLGIAGEAGEVADLIKKALFHGHEINKSDIKKELGDVLWYVSQIARLAGLTLEEVATANIDKLYKRYPSGFSEEASRNRVE
ncbi:nucleoside triphosphate pyrophosphohydrolase family protein [Bacillus sp. CGMCC 1.16607]|uniref:nucleoside triphosphate pyrophosphohydrolase family protein n=1 Tax=Bacillus sp. CGMCC 1.16607 TaxID=3351842 RepID=UPI0036437310